LDNFFDLILVGLSAFMGITALSAVIRMDKDRQICKQEDETDGECVECRGKEHSIHRYSGNAWKEVTRGRSKNRCEGNIKIEVVKVI
jgi:hypothetical protein